MKSSPQPPYDDVFVRHVLDIRIGGRYQLDRKLGSGTFGEVYQGQDVESGEEVALKLEHWSVAPSLIAEEVIVYESLATKVGFPQVLWHGKQDRYNIMVLDLLGPNLEDLLSYCGGQFSLKTTLMLADQLLTRFETFHDQGYLHRDVKPENFLMGNGRQGNVVYMTDLGLATSVPHTKSIIRADIHNETRKRQPHLLGTCRYASINGHYDGGRSCKDDLESLGYMLVYFIKGQLPWQGLRAETSEDKYDQVRRMKEMISASELCSGLPPAFEAYMDYIRSLPVSDSNQPKYSKLRRSFCNLFKKMGFCYDNVFDWTILEYQSFQDRKTTVAKTSTTTKGKQQGIVANVDRNKSRGRSKRARPIR